jgi:hypothetical protein
MPLAQYALLVVCLRRLAAEMSERELLFEVSDAVLLEFRWHTKEARSASASLAYSARIVEHAFLRFRTRGRGPLLIVLLVATVAVSIGIVFSTIEVNRLAAYVIIAGAMFETVVLGGYLALVSRHCGAGVDQALELLLARRHQLVSGLAVFGLTHFAFMQYPILQAGCASESFEDSRCVLPTYLGIVVMIILVTLGFRLRAVHSLIANGYLIATYVAGLVTFSTYSVVDYLGNAVIVLVVLVVFTLEAYSSERRERLHFESHVELQASRQRLGVVMESTQRVLRAALPHQLLDANHGLAAMVHRSNDATVCVTDIYDFAQWSCGELVHSVVLVLHYILTLCGIVGESYGLALAGSYGDCSVLCGALVDKLPDHRERATAFSRWLIDEITNAAVTGCVRLRASVCTGPLIGFITGASSLRFTVSGGAYDEAQRALLAAGPYEVVLTTVAPPSTESSPALGLSAPPQDTVASVTPPQSSHGDLSFSRVTLSFADTATQALFDEFVGEQERDVARFTALVPPALFATFLVVLGLEQASADDSRHHTAVLPYVGLAVAVTLSSVVAAIRLGNVAERLPFQLLYAMTATALAVGCVSLVFTGCVLAAPHPGIIFVLGTPTLFARLPWLAQTAVQATTVALPSILWVWLVYPFAHDFGRTLELIATVGVFIAVRYAAASLDTARFVAARGAVHAADAVGQLAEQHQALMAGLLPPHVMPHAVVSESYDLPRYEQRWRGLSVLQVAFARPTGSVAGVVQQMSDIWVHLPQLVGVSGRGMLEVVQRAGDSFMTAGPFAQPDAGISKRSEIEREDLQRLQAAFATMELLHALRDALPGTMTFTAIATAGEGVSALLGASLLSYRLFGVAVRESTALLAAAPRADWPVAFATDGFLQQHSNFKVRAPRVSGGGLSIAIRADEPRDHHSSGAATPQTSNGHEATQLFAAATLWRVRGVGVASVSAVRMTSN